MKKKASILFFMLTLMIIILIITLIMSTLFHVQTETLVIAKEGSNAFAAAQAGVEHGRNSIRTKFLNTTATICDGRNHTGAIIVDFITYGPVNDTRYRVEYSFVCITGSSPNYIRSLHSYNIRSIGTFRDATREITAVRP